MKIINGLSAVRKLASEATWSEWVSSAEMGEWYEAMMIGDAAYCAPVTRTWLEAAFEAAATCWAVFVCGAYGHDYETTVWPDDGYERIDCKRCGLSHDCWH